MWDAKKKKHLCNHTTELCKRVASMRMLACSICEVHYDEFDPPSTRTHARASRRLLVLAICGGEHSSAVGSARMQASTTGFAVGSCVKAMTTVSWTPCLSQQ